MPISHPILLSRPQNGPAASHPRLGAHAGVGLVVAWHQPRNPLGWLLLGAGVFLTLDSAASSLKVVDYRMHGRLPFGPAAVVLQPSWAPAIALFGLAFLLFPDGKPASPRWRWVVRCYLVVAILRFRLYEIDRIISRTLAYAIVTGLLIGVYAGLVLLATQALPFSLSTPVAVAGATLAAAALFSPLRRQVQRVVDRRFNRAR